MHTFIFNLTGSVAGSYKDIARTYGDIGFIEKDFAHNNMVKMAGNRKRIFHFYDDITPEETYDLITHQLSDITLFFIICLNSIGIS